MAFGFLVAVVSIIAAYFMDYPPVGAFGFGVWMSSFQTRKFTEYPEYPSSYLQHPGCSWPGFLIISIFFGLETTGGLILGFVAGIPFYYFLAWTSSRASFSEVQTTLAEADQMTGHEFESFIETVLQSNGFRTTGTSGSSDQGIDIHARKNGKDYSIQVKRWNSKVSRDAVTDAVGGRSYLDADHAMVITNNYFTSAAKEYASKTDCELVDRDKLRKWISESKGD